MLEHYFHQYGLVALLALLAVAIPAGMMMLSWLASLVRVRPRKPTLLKQSIYECGVQPIGANRWTRFNFRYYMFALLFVIFDVETVFIYPWAVRFGQLGLFALIEMLAFVLVLAVGLAYAWRKRALEWE